MDLMDLFIKVDVEDKASDKLSTLANKTETLANKIGNGLETAAKIGTAAVGAASAAVTALVKTSIDAYAEYEQLVGGVDTLFKDSSQKLKEYAEEAYRTAGVSTNTYMENAIGFSAKLIQDLGGDTAAAVELTDMAIKDMADNANKMGSDIASIQRAYQGFAKENYTMLDNLKLGYGGTADEAQRLLLDAEEILGLQEYSLTGLEGMIIAIHAVQEELGITGTTALEASTTISGSVGMAKAAWKNLLVAIADENQDFGAKMDEFVETIVGTTNESGEAVGGVLNNILPRVEIALNGVGTLVATALPKIMEYIPGIITDFLPKIVTAGAGIVRSLGEGIYDNKDEILGLFFGLVDDVLGVFKDGDSLTKFLNGGVEIVDDILDGIINAIPNLVDAALGIVDGLVGFFGDERNLTRLASGAIKLIVSLVTALTSPTTIGRLVDAATALVSGLMDYLFNIDNLAEIAGAALDIVDALAKGLIALVWKLGEAGVNLRDELCEHIGDFEWWKNVGKSVIDAFAAGVASNPLAKIFGVVDTAISQQIADSLTSYKDYTGDAEVIEQASTEAIRAEKFGDTTITNNSTSSTTNVGDINAIINNYSMISDEELVEMLARELGGVLSR